MRREEENLSGGEGESDVARTAARTTSEGQSPLMDREVPLPSGAGHAALHDWLDGELEQSRAREEEGTSQVELWTRINAESEMLRRRTTPVHVQKAIMSALSEDEMSLAEPTWQQSLTSTPAMLLLGALGAVIVGALALALLP